MKPVIYFPPDRPYIKEGYLVLRIHHDGQSGWMSKTQLDERIRDIVKMKPDARARLRRMRIYPYSPALRKIWEAYNEATVPAWKAYDEALASARKAYNEATVPAWKAYDEALASARKAYNEATVPAWKAMEARLKRLKFETGTQRIVSMLDGK